MHESLIGLLEGLNFIVISMEHCDRLLTNWFWQIAFSEHCTIDTVFFQQVVEKKLPDERVGVVVKCDGKYQVLYTVYWQRNFILMLCYFNVNFYFHS